MSSVVFNQTSSGYNIKHFSNLYSQQNYRFLFSPIDLLIHSADACDSYHRFYIRTLRVVDSSCFVPLLLKCKSKLPLSTTFYHFFKKIYKKKSLSERLKIKTLISVIYILCFIIILKIKITFYTNL